MAKRGYFSAENFTRRELPSGYTQVEYIESSGTQYIDSMFKPNQDTRVVLDFQVTAENSDLSENVVFGARSSASSKAFAVQWNTSNDNFQHFYNNGYDNLDFGKFDIRQIVEMNKNVFSLNGETHTRTYASFQCAYALYLFALNNAGTVAFYSKMRMYSCQIYDNGTLIRDYVPCLNVSGAAGLYDMVNGVFYGNAGTGSFSVGETLRENVAREAKKVYFADNNGIARMAKKAYFGDKNGIARLYYRYGTPISSIAVGESVFMNVNGVRTEFLVVHQGLPSSAYDASCDGTWLLMKECYEERAWDSSNNDYKNSDIHAYLNGTFLGMFDSDIQSAIKLVSLPYLKGTGYKGEVSSGLNGMATRIFLLSGYEVGWTTSDYDYIPVDGACLGYFRNTSAVDSKRVGYYAGIATEWWLRSAYTKYEMTFGGTGYISRVLNDGGCGTYKYDLSIGVRPALILPSDALVDENFNVIA